MCNNEYLIHEDDYIRHINEKVMLYSFVKQLTHHIGKMKPIRGNESLIKMAKCYDTAAENLFNSWGIPKSYLVFDNKEDLAELMENELIEPEEAGYFFCDDECCCGNCECCYEAEDYDDEDEEIDEDEDFAEMMAALSSVVHNIFGDNVSVHIVVE